MTFQILHQRALGFVKQIRSCEYELVEILIMIDHDKGFRNLGYASLFRYCVDSLRLSENEAYSFIKVARKSKEIPRLKMAVKNHELTVSQCRRITSVITESNCEEWINKAMMLSQKKLEKAVAKEDPKEAVKESFQYVQENRLKLTCGVSEELMKKLLRIKDLLSQKSERAVTLEEVISQLSDDYLIKNDPVIRAERILSQGKQQALRPVGRKPNAQIRHEVALRDNAQCTYKDPSGKRCEERRWVQLHHNVEFSKGGATETDNLRTLCFNHHRAIHMNRSAVQLR